MSLPETQRKLERPSNSQRSPRMPRPGVNLNPAATSYGGQVLQPALRRR